MKKVLVSGCFDLLHSGHVEFLQSAARYGDRLYVCIGSDRTVHDLKGRSTVCPEEERRFMLSALACVYEARVSRGTGILDFLPELEDIRPEIFVVNEDGHTPEKANLCAKKGIEYVVLPRTPHEGLPSRSTTALRAVSTIPFRVDLCGGWLDQPFVNRICPGPVIVASIEPTVEFNDRSGMASSTRKTAMELWKNGLPADDPENLGRRLFACDNPPGTADIAGSQDALGICLPGLSRLDYAGGDYWPKNIESNHEEDVLQFIENHVCMVQIGPRHKGYTVTDRTDITAPKAEALADAARDLWRACLSKDLKGFGKAMRDGARSQWAMFPNMVFDGLEEMIDQYEKTGALGYKLSGAGGGGYLILAIENPPPEAIKLKIRRKNSF